MESKIFKRGDKACCGKSAGVSDVDPPVFVPLRDGSIYVNRNHRKIFISTTFSAINGFNMVGSSEKTKGDP